MKPYYEDDAVTIYHGDCREILPSLGPFDVGFADPPYNYGLEYDVHDDRMDPAEYVAWCGEWFDALRLSSTRTIITPGHGNLLQWLERGPSGIAAWHKPGNPGGAGIFQFCEWEPVCVWGGGRIGGSDVFRATTNVTFGKTGRDGSAHPCPKPLKLMSALPTRFKATTVVDPFMGSGTTLRAAKDLGVRAVGIDVSEFYCELAARRMAQEVFDLGGVA